jgi:hypothetical protein
MMTTTHEQDAALSRDEMERIVARVRKLQAKADSLREIGSHAEAEAFAAGVAKTLLKYRLSMSDIDFAAYVDAEPMGKVDVNDLGTVRRQLWYCRLAHVVAKAHDCRAINHGSQDSAITIYGRPTARELAVYVLSMLVHDCERERRKAYGAAKAAGRYMGGFNGSFRESYVHHIAERYRDERASMERTATGTAMVRINQEAVAVLDFVTQDLRAQGFGGIKHNGGRVNMRNADAADAGRNAAARANIRGNGVRSGETGAVVRALSA